MSFTKFEKKEKPEDGSEVTEKIVYDALREVNDPELPVNIVDLGLIYDTKISGRTFRSR